MGTHNNEPLMNLEALCIRANSLAKKHPRQSKISQFPEMSKITDARLGICLGKKSKQL